MMWVTNKQLPRIEILISKYERFKKLIYKKSYKEIKNLN